MQLFVALVTTLVIAAVLVTVFQIHFRHSRGKTSNNEITTSEQLRQLVDLDTPAMVYKSHGKIYFVGNQSDKSESVLPAIVMILIILVCALFLLFICR